MHPKRLQNPNEKRPKAPRKDFDKLVKAAWDAGWWCERTGKNYILLYSPNGQYRLRLPSTPSSQATLRNKRRQLQRYGLDV